MCLLDVAEIPVLEVVVMLAVVNPLLQDVALNDTAQQHGGRVPWEKEETYRDCDGKDRKEILDPAINMRAVERPFMMPEVSRVEVPVGQIRKILLDRSL